MAKKKAKQVQPTPKQKLPKLDVTNLNDAFKCPHCGSELFQVKKQLDTDMVVQCVDCGDEWDLELEEECDDCVIEPKK